MKIQATPRYTQQTSGKQISPPVKCFCCQDSGLISNIYLSEFVEIPDRGDILPYICQRESCDSGQAYLRAYNMSDQERDAWHNNQIRGKDGDSIPKPMRAFEYRANFSTNLNDRCCDWLHDRSYDDWVDMIRNPKSPIVINKFNESVDDRNSQILEIKKAIAAAESKGINLKSKISATVKQCGDRDNLLYQNWEFLPSDDHARMLTGIQDLIKPKAAITSVPSEEYYATINF